MAENLISRRKAILLTGAGLASVGLTGCCVPVGVGPTVNTVASAVRVVVQLSWTTILQVTSCTLSHISRILSAIVVVGEGVQQFLQARLSDSAMAQLEDGGTLILRARDGQEFEVPFTITEV